MASHLPSFITPWLAKPTTTKKNSAGKKSFNGHTALYTYIISNQASTSARERHTSKHGLNSQVCFFLH